MPLAAAAELPPPTRSQIGTSHSANSTPRPRTRAAVAISMKLPGNPSRDLISGRVSGARRSRAASPASDGIAEDSPLRTRRRKSSQDAPAGRSIQNTASRLPPSRDLNSSPIKSESPGSDGRKRLAPLTSSSPRKKSKSVAFSDTLLAQVSSLPLRCNVTPSKSILKNSPGTVSCGKCLQNAASDDHSGLCFQPLPVLRNDGDLPDLPAFWQEGVVVQLEKGSRDLLRLVSGCLSVLENSSFPRKFEVYATLNQLCKVNDVQTVHLLFSGSDDNQNADRKLYVEVLAGFLRRDIEIIEASIFLKHEPLPVSPNKHDPFQARVLGQALKLAATFLCSGLNTHLADDDIEWFYSHTCEIIVRPTLSKTLVLPYLGIIKDYHVVGKRRRLIFENPTRRLSESMLHALLNLPSFPSASLMNEKFTMLRNLIHNFPTIMAKSFHHWFTALVINATDESFMFHAKVVASATEALLEAVKCYKNSADVCATAQKLFESPVPLDLHSFTSSPLNCDDSDTLLVTRVVLSLRELINRGSCKIAMNIWLPLTLLVGTRNLENWTHLQSWLSVHKACFNLAAPFATALAISAWKGIVYRVAYVDFRAIKANFAAQEPLRDVTHSSPNSSKKASLDDLVRPKARLLLHLFTNSNFSNPDTEIAEAFFDRALSIIYGVVNSNSKKPVPTVLWDKVIVPLFISFFFKDLAVEIVLKMGVSVLLTLLRVDQGSEKKLDHVRCLSNEAIGLDELAPVLPRWLHSHFERFMPIFVAALRHRALPVPLKLRCLDAFLYAIKLVTKKEPKPSDTTLDIIDGVPLFLAPLLANSELDFFHYDRILINLSDAFGMSNLILEAFDQDDAIDVIVSNFLHAVSPEESLKLISSIHERIVPRLQIAFFYRLHRCEGASATPEVMDFIVGKLNVRNLDKFLFSEMWAVSEMFRLIDRDFAPIAKRLIQQLVLLNEHEFLAVTLKLRICDWHINIVKFYVTLVRDAPLGHLRDLETQVLRHKLQHGADIVDLLQYLTENGYRHEILLLRDDICKALTESEDCTAWESYIGSAPEPDKQLLMQASCDASLPFAIRKEEISEEASKMRDSSEPEHGANRVDIDDPVDSGNAGPDMNAAEEMPAMSEVADHSESPESYDPSDLSQNLPTKECLQELVDSLLGSEEHTESSKSESLEDSSRSETLEDSTSTDSSGQKLHSLNFDLRKFSDLVHLKRKLWPGPPISRRALALDGSEAETSSSLPKVPSKQVNDTLEMPNSVRQPLTHATEIQALEVNSNSVEKSAEESLLSLSSNKIESHSTVLDVGQAEELSISEGSSSIFTSLVKTLSRILPDQIAAMAPEEKYQLETSMLQFMLMMRDLGLGHGCSVARNAGHLLAR